MGVGVIVGLVQMAPVGPSPAPQGLKHRLGAQWGEEKGRAGPVSVRAATGEFRHLMGRDAQCDQACLGGQPWGGALLSCPSGGPPGPSAPPLADLTGQGCPRCGGWYTLPKAGWAVWEKRLIHSYSKMVTEVGPPPLESPGPSLLPP